MKNITLTLIALCLLSACATTQNPQSAQHKCIEIGQEWQYDHRDGEEASRVVIIDVVMTAERKRIYVIRVTGVNIDHPNFRNYFPDRVPYFIISEEGLQASLTKLVGESSWNRFYDRNYQAWRKQNAGHDYFGFKIKDKLRVLEDTLKVKLGA